MTGVPVETVVELIVENRIGDTLLLNGKVVYFDGIADMKVKVREYVETLVRKDATE
jgi:hypothetical protein